MAVLRAILGIERSLQRHVEQCHDLRLLLSCFRWASRAAAPLQSVSNASTTCRAGVKGVPYKSTLESGPTLKPTVSITSVSPLTMARLGMTPCPARSARHAPDVARSSAHVEHCGPLYEARVTSAAASLCQIGPPSVNGIGSGQHWLCGFWRCPAAQFDLASLLQHLCGIGLPRCGFCIITDGRGRGVHGSVLVHQLAGQSDRILMWRRFKKGATLGHPNP